MTMEPMQTMERKVTKLVGYTVTASLNEELENELVSKLRDELLNNRHNIANQLDDNGIYLIQVYSDCEWTPDVPFESIVAVAVSDWAPIPEGFIQHTLPAGQYAKFTHKGPESQLDETYDSIRETGIAADRPFDFEYWPDVHSLGQAESKIDIYLPLEA